MSIVKKFGGAKLAKLAMKSTPKYLKDQCENSLRLQLSGFVQVWNMDDDPLARPNGGNEVTRCDFAVFQSGVPVDEKKRRLCLVEFTNSIGGDTVKKVQRQLEGGLHNVLLELAEGENPSFDELMPIFVPGCRSIGKHAITALAGVSLTYARGTAWLIVCKSGSTLKDQGIIDPPSPSG